MQYLCVHCAKPNTPSRSDVNAGRCACGHCRRQTELDRELAYRVLTASPLPVVLGLLALVGLFVLALAAGWLWLAPGR